MAAIEVGYRLGRVLHRRSAGEKESPVSAMEAALLGLLAFMLAFTFDIVSGRFDERKSLVRQEANAIGTAYLRADFLAEPDRAASRRIMKAYVSQRLAAVLSRDVRQMDRMLADSEVAQRELWRMAVDNARKDLNSDVGALYIEAVNEMICLHRLRISIGLQSRVPAAIWLVFYGLILLGMFGVGYQTAIAGSKRSMAGPIMALSFSLVVTLIAELDRPRSRYIPVPQPALQNLLDRMTLHEDSGPVTPSAK
jgi:hypothetical protein